MRNYYRVAALGRLRATALTCDSYLLKDRKLPEMPELFMLCP